VITITMGIVEVAFLAVEVTITSTFARTRSSAKCGAISDARDKVDGQEDKDQGIHVNGKANVVPSTADAIALRRTPQEVLHIIYLTDKRGVSKGGFYPNGVNGGDMTRGPLARRAAVLTGAISPPSRHHAESIRYLGLESAPRRVGACSSALACPV
jgi:hypothetical protein